VLALNGPVGAGKSTLARTIADLARRRGLRLAVASIDDLYLPLPERRSRLAGNPFGVCRVPPGSHDVPLLLERLQAWRSRGNLRLPCFDKSLAAGEGERSGEREQEADALLLEGWLMGCHALGTTRLAQLLAEGLQGWPLSEAELDWIPHWDRALADYQPLWQACDGLWLLRPTAWTLPRRWRFQAEARQRRLGAGWLDGAALESLVRSSVHSLPPPLYQDPLLVEEPQGLPLLGVSVLDGRRRVVAQSTHSSASSASSAIG
jgi:D-glycerate 3-kinase